MSTVSLLTRIDPKVKSEAQKTAKKMGLSLSAVVNRLLREFIETKTITYSTEEPTPYLKAILKRAMKNRGQDSPTFDNAKDAIAFLHKQIK